MHTLTNGTTTAELDPGMLWEDEFAWLPQTARAQRATDGSLLIEASALPSGRPITLAGGDDYGWASRATVLALRALLAIPAQVMTLVLDDGREFQVIAAPQQQPLEARMVLPYGRPVDGDWYVVTIRLIGV